MAATRSPDYEYTPVPLPTAAQEHSKGNVQVKNVHVGAASVNPSLDEKSAEIATQQPGWTSTYLRKTTLLGFSVVFLCLLLAVIALAVVDAKHNGIANAKSSEHYLWTYGPTAVLVIVAAFWTQVENRTKSAMPWVILQQKATPASKTLFMDYVTPGKPEALWASLRNLHWPVAITIINSLLITLLTVASTGLLALQSTPFVRHDCRLNMTDDFVTTFNPSNIGSPSALATLAIENGTIPFPPGTSRYGAFQHIAPPASLSAYADLEVEGLVRSFYGGLSCEVATVRSGSSGCSDLHCRAVNVTIDITSPTCNIKGYNLTQGCERRLDAVTCDFDKVWGTSCNSHADGHDNTRLIFMFGQIDQNLGGFSKNETEAVKIVTGNTTTIVCEARYNITDSNAIVDRMGNLKDTSFKASSLNQAQRFPAWSLVDGLLTASDAAGQMIAGGYSYSSYNFAPWNSLHRLFKFWVDAAHPSSNLKDPAILQSRANEMFAMATAQMAKQSLMRPSADFTLGTCRGTEDRLRVRGLSLYLMASILVLLIMSTVSLVYIAPQGYSSRDPSSIGGMALVLSRSPTLLSRLAKAGASDLKTMKRQMGNDDCQAVFSRHGSDWMFELDLSSNEASQGSRECSEAALASPTYWRPLSLRPVFKVSVIAALVVLVVVLEVLYSLSNKNDGLVEVNPHLNQRFAWVYVPAIVMITAQTLVGMIAFSSLMVFPYFRLRRETASTRKDILQHYVSETAIKCLWQSIPARHIVVMCMAIAMLLTPLLTIAVSGLYTAQPTSVNIPVGFSIENQFNASFMSGDISASDGTVYEQSANNIGLLLSQNFTFPRWTYDELVFPEAKLQLPANVNSSILLGSNITVTLPGLRSDLTCKIAPSVPTNFTDTRGTEMYRKMNVTDFEALGVYNDNGMLSWPDPGMNPFGFFSSCDGLEFRNMSNTFCGAMGVSQMNWNAFTCAGVINQLDVAVTMDASTLNIIAAKPDESTIRFFSKETLAPGDLGDYPSSMVPSLFGSSNFGGQRSVAGFFDPVFQAVIYRLGTHDDLAKFPMQQYLSNEGFHTIFNELQHVHRIVTAQSADLIRVPLNTTAPLAPPSNVNATLVNPHVYRLHQSAVSTRILDGLLIATAICIGLSFGLMNTRKILPKNPASIAAAASLIAGDAHMLKDDVLPKGAQWFSDAEIQAKKLWGGSLFKLGWWDIDGMSVRDGQGDYFKLDSL